MTQPTGWAYLNTGQAKLAHYYEPDRRSACRSYGSTEGPDLDLTPAPKGFRPTAKKACNICRRQRLVASRG